MNAPRGAYARRRYAANLTFQEDVLGRILRAHARRRALWRLAGWAIITVQNLLAVALGVVLGLWAAWSL